MSRREFIAIAPVMLHGIIDGKPSKQMHELCPKGEIGTPQIALSVSEYNLVEVNGKKYYKQKLNLTDRPFNDSYYFISEDALNSEDVLELVPFDSKLNYKVMMDVSAHDNCYNHPSGFTVKGGSIIGGFDEYCTRMGHHFFSVISGSAIKQGESVASKERDLKLSSRALVHCPAPSSSGNFYDPRLLQPA